MAIKTELQRIELQFTQTPMMFRLKILFAVFVSFFGVEVGTVIERTITTVTKERN